LNARENRNDFSLDLNVPSESLSVTVLGREFQVAGAEQRNARLANAGLANGLDNRVVVVERRVREEVEIFKLVSKDRDTSTYLLCMNCSTRSMPKTLLVLSQILGFIVSCSLNLFFHLIDFISIAIVFRPIVNT